MKFVLFFYEILKSEEGRTDTKCENSDHYGPLVWVGLVDQLFFPRLHVCDGKVNCPDGSDETVCVWNMTDITDAKETPIFNEITIDENELTPLKLNLTSNEQEISTITTEESASKKTRSAMYETSLFRKRKPKSLNFGDTEYLSDQTTHHYTTEQSVSRYPSLYNVKVYPPNQEVFVGNDIVIQCRDEGLAREEVAWRKLNRDQALPDKVTQEYGRLIIPKAVLNDHGFYECYVENLKLENVEKGSSAISKVAVRSRNTP